MNIGFGATLIALATLFGAFIGAVTQVLIRRRDIQRERQNLRIALLQELRNMTQLNDERLDQLGYLEDPEKVIPSTIYEGNTQKIGLLSPEEVTEVSKFHSSLKTYKQLMKGSDSFPDDHDVWDVLEEFRNAVEDQRQTAIDELESHESSTLLNRF